MGLNDENVIKVGGWLVSLLCILIGLYFVWPHIHVALVGIVFIYLGVRVFNFFYLQGVRNRPETVVT